MDPLIHLQNVSKAYDGQLVFKDLNFDIFSEEVLVILGYSGVGKTSLLRIISQLDEDYSGEIIYSEEVFKDKNIPLPVIFQDFNQLLPWYNVKKNILLPYEQKKIDQRLFKRVIEALALTEALAKYPAQLSGGMKQRVAIARALLSDSTMLLMDEPFGSLDVVMRRNLQDLILQIKNKFNRSIFFITHDIEEALLIADRILIMKDHETLVTLDYSNVTLQRYTKAFDVAVQKIVKILQ